MFPKVLYKRTVKEQIELITNWKRYSSNTNFCKQWTLIKQCSIVQFALECQDNLTVFINAYEVELICGPITNQTIEIAQQCYLHLQGLPLADYSRGDEDREIDVIIGADHYWSVVQNH